MKISHDRLVKKARSWLLKKGYPVVISEMTASREEPDAIGFKSGGYSAVIEVKTSRSDFNNDMKKASRGRQLGMGDIRYYLVPEGLVGTHEIPQGWGLLVWKGKGIREILNAMPKLKDCREELNLFVSCIRRVHGPIQGTSIKHYEYITKSRAVLITKDTEYKIPEGVMIDLGWANGWRQDPIIVKECQRQKHKTSDTNRDPTWHGLHNEVRCNICRYVYHYDSSD